jgi:hypothetical protein
MPPLPISNYNISPIVRGVGGGGGQDVGASQFRARSTHVAHTSRKSKACLQS